MLERKTIKETGVLYESILTGIGHPVILEQNGESVAVLMSIQEYDRYQALLKNQGQLLASEARHLADQAFFKDLVGCAISSSDPLWIPEPHPHWRIPYRFFDGTLLTFIEVDAKSGNVFLTEQEREHLLLEIERLVQQNASQQHI